MLLNGNKKTKRIRPHLSTRFYEPSNPSEHPHFRPPPSTSLLIDKHGAPDGKNEKQISAGSERSPWRRRRRRFFVSNL